uniref:Uncharacterized protein n=1 Tax=Ananas comosus var. bracteatus TaxID=296719 RepID=A0A6V7NIN8_ANACO|nr:unnamed protein product [Ananas comosus var. bracteatus]
MESRDSVDHRFGFRSASFGIRAIRSHLAVTRGVDRHEVPIEETLNIKFEPFTQDLTLFKGDLNWVTLLSRAQRPRLDSVPLREWWLCNNRGLSPDSQPNPTNEEHRYNPLGTVYWVVTLTHLKYSGNQCLGRATTAKLTDVM